MFSHEWERFITVSYILTRIDIAKYIRACPQTLLLLDKWLVIRITGCYVSPMFSAGSQYEEPFTAKAYGFVHFMTGLTMETARKIGVEAFEPERLKELGIFRVEFRNGVIALKYDKKLDPSVIDSDDGISGELFKDGNTEYKIFWAIPKELP